ncbi:TPA: bifunctional protein-disulfide isomerase/oxidoreductase DsbC [Haemophilus influenzae]|uniref:bifunctional protein-disulfide isomerase/oxidoreductase DsbC n=1 Tax=Haemophilus TaxID=724 RepID=UPI0008A9DBA2|nr:MULTISPECIES: bifunctional protein-disulfide isomerase/oxidoreductase DsbC [Haemophilus]AXP60168.1 bifunctional protein-disulfide isomerase/oxidoreductase DsbC [Haemophilus influenzae]AXP63668.1 bifunctional protein-disulfide isomerase/oxidoreductase DsbC [Haemophilus influenzae]MCK8859295.1 bifunctional protein-disulfide isomerase/oxidoreductase DsbC [Haemophilus influenzae]MCK9018516.1 bifunctional protein-disulfide isomerase/oxidoreductase DsbC [Haemophilus influenzae]MCK9662636.1 bifunc
MKKIFTALLCVAAANAMADDAAIKRKLQSFNVSNIAIKSSPISGIRTAVTDQGILYVSEDGKYLFEGKLYELTNNGPVDFAGKILVDKLNSYKDEMIVYPAKNEKHVVTVFMDITCHYCHLLHQQLKEYNDLGITVRYLAFPRAGMNNQTAKQMEAIWTAKDPVFALNEAEDGNLPKEVKTPNIVKKHYELGIQFGVRGTPSIVTSTGELIGGYLKPADLLRALEETAQ